MDLLTQFYVTVGLMVFSGALGYYVGERGWSGVQNDLNNIKIDVAHIQGKLGVSPTKTTTITAPVAGSPTTNTSTITTTPSK